ncbi:unnamed protein product [Symbiodinium sp. CCMP2592]|nr:unnamed protein product [Symbiodinium sp. CCMP2592]
MEKQTDANSPHWVCLLIAIWQYDKAGGFSSLEHVEEEATEVHRALIESGLCQEVHCVTEHATFEQIKAEVKSAVQKLGRDSKLLVVYMGHSHCGPGGFTWIVPSCGLKWNNCVLLEGEVKAEAPVCRQQKSGFCLDLCFIFSSCRTGWEQSPLKGTRVHPDSPVWSDDDTVQRFYACPQRHPIMDYPFLGFALASFLRARPDTFETLMSSLKDEIKYISLGELDPERGGDPPPRVIHLYVGGATSSSTTDAIMTDSVLGCFRNAVLLWQHLVDAISAEMSMSNYAATREHLKAAASVVKRGQLVLPDGKWWLCDIELQLQVLATDQLLGIRSVLTEYLQGLPPSPPRRVAEAEIKSWGKIRKETMTRFVKALCADATRLGSDRRKLGIGVRRLLTILARSCREISPPAGAREIRNEEAMRVPGVEANNMAHQDHINFIEEWYSVCKEMGIDDMDPNYILYGSLYIFSLTGAIPDGQKQLFCQRLQERLRQPDRLKDWSCALSFARTPAFQLPADVPVRLTNLVSLAEHFRGQLDPAPTSCCLHVRGFKDLVETWIDQGNWEEGSKSDDWRLRLIYGGVELADREWLRGASNLQVVVEPTWRFWTQHPKFEALGAEMTGLIRKLSTKALDGHSWADDEAFMDLVLASSSLAAEGPELHELVLRVLRGAEASTCQTPQDMEIHFWKEIFASPIPPAPECRASPLEASGSSTAFPEVKGSAELLQQFERLPRAKLILLQLLSVNIFVAAAGFARAIEVLRGLSQPVATRGSSAADPLEEIDGELEQTLEKLRDDIESVGVDRAIDLFIEEWN